MATHIVNMERGPNDMFPTYAWPGGYLIVYLDQNAGDLLCSECVTEEVDILCSGDDNQLESPKEGSFYADILYEGVEYCAGCNKELVGSYED